MPDAIQSVLDALNQKWRDARATLFNVQADASADPILLTGEVLKEEQRAEVETAVSQAAPGRAVANEIAVLSQPDTGWALIRSSASNLRITPSNKTEMTAQGLFGEPVEMLKRDERDWWLVRLSDGYIGWTVESYLFPCSREFALGYRQQASALVLAELAWAYSGPEESDRLRVGRLPFGVPVRAAERSREMIRVNWEGEPPLWVAERDLLPISERPAPDSAGVEWTLQLMGRFIGVPYLWGGETPFGFDCSGYAQTALEFLGLRIPRDADQQCAAGRRIEGDPRPGDLLFFTKNAVVGIEQPGPITHVALSLGGTEFIHSTQILWGVQRNSFDPSSPIYRASLAQRLVDVRRFI